MAENRKAKDKRYYFNWGQLVLLGSGFAVVSVIVFLLGILVGQSIEERKIVKPAEPIVKIPFKPATQGANAASVQPKEEITFYETLTRSTNAPAPLDKPQK